MVVSKISASAASRRTIADGGLRLADRTPRPTSNSRSAAPPCHPDPDLKLSVCNSQPSLLAVRRQCLALRGVPGNIRTGHAVGERSEIRRVDVAVEIRL